MQIRTLVLMLVAAAVWAEAPETRPARTADLAGTWQMVALLKPADADAGDSTFAPFQLYRFDPNGRMKHMTASKPFTSLALFDAAPLITRYALDRRGILTLSNPAWDAPHKYVASIVTKPPTASDAKLPRAGDLVIAENPEQGSAAWSKLLRKID
jgi:hypothetical protein